MPKKKYIEIYLEVFVQNNGAVIFLNSREYFDSSWDRQVEKKYRYVVSRTGINLGREYKKSGTSEFLLRTSEIWPASSFRFASVHRFWMSLKNARLSQKHRTFQRMHKAYFTPPQFPPFTDWTHTTVSTLHFRSSLLWSLVQEPNF